MTRLEKLKFDMCNAIKSMPEETFFEFISEYDDDDTYFSKEILFTCKKCQQLYGNCEAHNSDSANYNTCKARFNDYCNKNCD